MNRFAPLHQVRYNPAHPTGGAYGRLNEETPLRGSGSSTNAGGVATAGNILNVFGFALDRSLICHLPRSVTKFSALGKLESSKRYQPVLNLSLIRKNK